MRPDGSREATVPIWRSTRSHRFRLDRDLLTKHGRLEDDDGGAVAAGQSS